MYRLLILTLLLSTVLYAAETAESPTFSEQLQKVNDTIANNKLILNPELVPGNHTTIIDGLFSLQEERIDHFLIKGEKPLLLTADISAYTAISLNPIYEKDRFLYPLLIGDVKGADSIRGIILYTEADGTIAYALIKTTMTPEYIIKLVDDAFFPDEAEMEMTMIDTKSNGRKTEFSFRIHSVRNQASVMEFIAPKRELGKKILLKDNNLWMYSPRTSRPIRLSNRQKFMGSSFSNNDLMDSSLADDYNITINAIENIQDVPCLKLDLAAKNKKVTYPRIAMWLRTDNLITMQVYYYTPSGKILKKMITRNIQLLGGRERATELVMQNMFEKGQETIVRIDAIDIKPVDPKVFTESYLKR